MRWLSLPIRELIALAFVCNVAVSAQTPPPDAAHERALGELVGYGNDVKPILVRRCYACHGPDGDARKASLRLDDRADLLRLRDGEITIVVPGDSSASELLVRLREHDADDRMPPEGPALEADEIDLIARWVDQGAAFETHWSLVPIKPIAAPSHEVAQRDPIDNFIAARLQAANLRAAGDAPPAAQLRRLSFDLRGLAPTAQEVIAYENDPSDDAWAQTVDRYLADPAFSERWARHWLDLVRYAETCGHEFDYPIADAWRYRDYVIRAFDANVPFDRFIREHLAGDLLAPRVDQTTGVNQSPLATGMWFFGQAVHGPVDVRADELDRVENQIDILGKAFLGLTIACARCHDHKFDPILQSEYYGLAGYFSSSRRSRTTLDRDGALASIRTRILEAQQAHETQLATAAAAAGEATLLRILTSLHDAATATNATVSTERIFEDFESGDFSQWSATGNAFARGPQSRATVRSAFFGHFDNGKFILNTCDDRPGGDGDDGEGTLTSAPFTIDEAVLRFSISGGNDPKTTAVELLLDDAVVRSAHGRNDQFLRGVEWDVTPFVGRSARLRVRDQRGGGWGHIVADDFRFGSVLGGAPKLTQSMEELGASCGLSRDGVAMWLSALHDQELSDSRHPLGSFALAAESQPGQHPEPAVRFDDRAGRAQWYADGFAFANEQPYVLNSGALDERMHGTLRSSTFRIEHKHIILRVRGRGTIRLNVDGFMMDEFNALLFEGFKQTFNDPSWHIRVFDSTDYIGERAWIELIDDGPGFFEVESIVFDDNPAARAQPLGVLADAVHWNNPVVRRWIIDHNLTAALPQSAQPFGESLLRYTTIGKRIATDWPTVERSLALTDGTVVEEPLLSRGDHHAPGAIVPRGLVEVVSGPLSIPNGTSGRRELASAIVDPANPLTARVFVNRLWHHLLGRGIVATTDDFGALGAMPTHPELLDHLAMDFLRDWSIKRMIRRIVTSSVYRRSSLPVDGTASQVDPNNDLLSHARIRRLQGEAIRDSMLQVSGALNTKRFGPPVATALTPFMTGRGRPGASGPVDGDGRRSIYLEVRRNFPDAFLTVFDLPAPMETIGVRTTSNVPAQALTMMNAPFVHEVCDVWSKNAMKNNNLQHLFRSTFARAATENELQSAKEFLGARGNSEAAWAALCHALLNAKEFIHLN